MKRINMMKVAMLLVITVLGCVNIGDNGVDNSNNDQEISGVKTNNTAMFLCVGMEMSKRFGACPGCELDARRMTSILRDRMGYDGTTLISSQATKKAVVEKLKEGIEKTPENGLFLFIYSGHGGQEHLGYVEPDGSDRDDEYLCLYDTYMLDDEIWNIVSKCKGRVFLYFDACHSATMYRSVASENKISNISGVNDMVHRLDADGNVAIALAVHDLVSSKGFTFSPEKFIEASAMSTDGTSQPIRMLCWSGCKEMEYSYGSAAGGVMTSSVMAYIRSGMSYDTLWKNVVNRVQAYQPTQHPVQTKIGNWPVELEVFR